MTNKLLNPVKEGFTVANGMIEIKWIGSNDIRSIKLEYSDNGGKSWITIINNYEVIPGKENKFIWNGVPDKSTRIALIRISDTGGIYTVTSKRFVVER